MKNALRLLVPFAVIVMLSQTLGCSALVAPMVANQLNMNSTGPDFPVPPAVASMGEAERFYAELLASANDDFASIRGATVSGAERKRRIDAFMVPFAENTARQVERGLVAPEQADALVSSFRRGFQRGEFADLTGAPPGATPVGWSRTVQNMSTTNMIATTAGVSFYYPVDSKEEGRAVLRELSDLFNRIIARKQDWVIQDLDGKRAYYREMAGYDAQSARAGYPGSPYDWDTLANGPISSINFDYRWKSEARIMAGPVTTPAIDLVSISIHNNLEDPPYNYQDIMNGGNISPGSHVVVGITKSTSVNGN